MRDTNFVCKAYFWCLSGSCAQKAHHMCILSNVMYKEDPRQMESLFRDAILYRISCSLGAPQLVCKFMTSILLAISTSWVTYQWDLGARALVISFHSLYIWAWMLGGDQIFEPHTSKSHHSSELSCMTFQQIIYNKTGWGQLTFRYLESDNLACVQSA